MLRDMEREKPGEYKKLHDVTFKPKPGLEELGVTKMQSHRWQLEAEVPEEQMTAFIARTIAKAEELTSRAVIGMLIKSVPRVFTFSLHISYIHLV